MHKKKLGVGKQIKRYIVFNWFLFWRDGFFVCRCILKKYAVKHIYIAYFELAFSFRYKLNST